MIFFNVFNIPTLKKNTNTTTLGSSSHTSQDEKRNDNKPCRGFKQREALTLSMKMELVQLRWNPMERFLEQLKAEISCGTNLQLLEHTTPNHTLP